MKHWNNSTIDPAIDDLPHIWRGWWMTDFGEKIHARLNFPLYWEVLRLRNPAHTPAQGAP